jgi:hypothetical protein
VQLVTPTMESKAAEVLDVLHALGSLAALCSASGANLWTRVPPGTSASPSTLRLAVEAAAAGLVGADLTLRPEDAGGVALFHAAEALPIFYQQYRCSQHALLVVLGNTMQHPCVSTVRGWSPSWHDAPD